VPCGFWRRLASIVYDAAIVIALLMLAALAAMLAGFRDQTALRDTGYTLYLAAVWCGYVTGCWHIGGMTLGMRAWRVRIEDQQGGRPGWPACLARFAFSIVSAAAAGIGFIWAFANPEKRCWHDILSRTRLIRY
jgi:uncharacterized RDD family membrane protein YckC